MKIFICILPFTIMLSFNSVQSVRQIPGPSRPLRPNQPQPRNVLKYNASDDHWYLNGDRFGMAYDGTVVNYRPMEVCKQPYCRQRRRQVKLGEYEPVGKEARLVAPRLQEGDMMYRRGDPIGIVGKDFRIWEYHPSHGGKPRRVKAMNGDTLVLNGQWTINEDYGIIDYYRGIFPWMKEEKTEGS